MSRSVRYMVGVLLSLILVLAACGTDVSEETTAGPTDTTAAPTDTTAAPTDTTAAPATTPEETRTLDVFEWGVFCPDEAREAFEEEFNAVVNCSFYQGNEELRTRLLTGGDTFGIVMPSRNFVPSFVEDGLLQSLDLSLIPNYEDLLETFTETDQTNIDGEVYGVPHASGIAGICYRTDLVEGEITSWGDLLDPAYAGRIGMTGNQGDTVFMSFGIYLGIDPAALTDMDNLEAELPRIVELVEQQNELDPLFYQGAEQQGNLLRTGDAWIVTSDHGLCSTLALDDVPVDFVVPEEGGWAWIDVLAVPSNAPDPELAHQWINHMISPEMSALLIEEEGFFVVNPRATEHLSPEVAEAVAIPEDVLIYEWPSYPEEVVQEMVAAYLEARG